MNWQLITYTSIYDVVVPKGIRNDSGYVLFFPSIGFWKDQKERYVQECEEALDRAQKILEFLKKEVDTSERSV